MFILVGISAIPIFIVQHFNKNCSTWLRWLLFIFSFSLYMLLSVICREYGVLAERKGFPITPFIILAILSGLQLFSKKTPMLQEIAQDTEKDTNLNKTNILHNQKFHKFILLIIIFIALSLGLHCFVHNISFNKQPVNYWMQPYTTTRLDALRNEIDIFELKRLVPEKVYENEVESDGYFYNIGLVKLEDEYAISFDVWQINNKKTKDDIVDDMQCTASLFLRDDERDKIKIIVSIAPKGQMDMDDESYRGYIPLEIFKTCRKQD